MTPTTPLAGCGLWRNRRIGVLGGSFNPAHDGHRHISLLALRVLGLDYVWWLVSPQNPLKSVAETAPHAQRIAQARRVARHRKIHVSGLEAHFRTTYTVDTLAALKRAFPRARFVWLMGADNLLQAPRWRRWRRIFQCAPIAVFNRAPYGLRALQGRAAGSFARRRIAERRRKRLADAPPPAWVFLRHPLHPASSTALRYRGFVLK